MPKSQSLTRTNPFPALRLALIGLAFAVGAPAHAKDHAKPVNRGVESDRQPVVQRTDFVFDVAPDGYSGMSRDEQKRLVEWFNAIDLGYGDRVAIADEGLYNRSGFAEAVGNLVARYGLLLADQAPVTAGQAANGGVRIVVSRTTATVPGCPDWKGKYEGDFTGGTSYNYGCATNGNLAIMVADPEDLVTGRTTHSPLRTAASDKAIKAYSDAAPTGGGGTKTGGN